MSVTDIEHLRIIMDERDKRYEQRFLAQETALGEAKHGIEARLVLLNELRADVATKAEVDALEKLLGPIVSRLDRMEGKSSGLNAGWAILLAVVTLVIGVYAVWGK
jgi:hypothetical protein